MIENTTETTTQTTPKKSAADIFAKAIRVITLPPILFTIMAITLYFTTEVFNNYVEIIIAVLFLGVLPTLAYPVHLAIPALRMSGRKGQRTLAFIFSVVGYTAGLFYGIFGNVTGELLFVFIVFFAAVIILTFVNKAIKIKASGHACSSVTPCAVLCFLCKWYCLFPCLAIIALSVWASLRTKRHTPLELLSGAIVSIVAFIIALLFYIFLIR